MSVPEWHPWKKQIYSYILNFLKMPLHMFYKHFYFPGFHYIYLECFEDTKKTLFDVSCNKSGFLQIHVTEILSFLMSYFSVSLCEQKQYMIILFIYFCLLIWLCIFRSVSIDSLLYLFIRGYRHYNLDLDQNNFVLVDYFVLMFAMYSLYRKIIVNTPIY